MYPVVENFNASILQGLFEGASRALSRNPNPAICVHKLIGRASSDLIILSDDPTDSALLTEVRVDDFNKKYLYLWVAYSNSPFDVTEAAKALRWVANQTGCLYIEFRAQRGGWGSKLASIKGLDATEITVYRGSI